MLLRKVLLQPKKRDGLFVQLILDLKMVDKCAELHYSAQTTRDVFVVPDGVLLVLIQQINLLLKFPIYKLLLYLKLLHRGAIVIHQRNRVLKVELELILYLRQIPFGVSHLAIDLHAKISRG